MAIKNRTYTVFLLLMLVLTGCKKSFAPIEYKQWIESEENGLHKKKLIGEMEYEMQYQTPEYLLLLNKGPRAFEQEMNLEEELEKYSDDIQFLFTIRNLDGIPPLNYNIRNEQEYYARIQYLNSKVSEDFFLINAAKDTTTCMFVHLERDFGIGPEIRLSIAFDKQEMQQDFQLCFDDKLFNNGMIKFSLLEEDLNDLPELRNK